MSRNTLANRNITRMAYEKATGYWVRVVKDGKLHTKFFADSLFEGQRKALTAARNYRDALRIKLFGSLAEATRRVHTSNRQNKSGKIGVHYTERIRGNYVSRTYVATWVPKEGGPQRHKHFSVNRLGKREAFKAAVAFRKEREAEILASKV